jgi:hypothetical protein
MHRAYMLFFTMDRHNYFKTSLLDKVRLSHMPMKSIQEPLILTVCVGGSRQSLSGTALLRSLGIHHLILWAISFSHLHLDERARGDSVWQSRRSEHTHRRQSEVTRGGQWAQLKMKKEEEASFVGLAHLGESVSEIISQGSPQRNQVAQYVKLNLCANTLQWTMRISWK